MKAFKGVARNVWYNPSEGTTNFSYHSTVVVALFQDGRVRLNSGGWRTVTTKKVINQALTDLRLKIKVFQKNFEWFIQTPKGIFPFEEDTLITPEGKLK